ncbi:HD domain-containing protein [bacterium]|nr:HD domain-containing protein [bacterium]
MSKKILIVDSSEQNLNELRKILEPEGYVVITQTDPMTVRAAIIISSPDLIIMGTDFSDFDGLDLCERIKKDKLIQTMPIIINSSVRDENKIARAFEIGAVDFITKPYHAGELKARVSTHINLYALKTQLEEKNKQLETTVEEQSKTITEMQMATIFSLAKLAQSRDDDTGKHLERVQKYCYALATELSKGSPYKNIVTKEYIKDIVYACPLHDIGKVAIPDAILLKPGKLTDEEFAEMKKHTIYGAETLNEVYERFGSNDFIKMGIDIAKYHHERWDGKGYPEGLSGENIPLSARIMAIADVYDALSSRRAYKDAFPHKKCAEIIMEGKNTQFDGILVDAFVNIQDEFAMIKQLYGDITPSIKYV